MSKNGKNGKNGNVDRRVALKVGAAALAATAIPGKLLADSVLWMEPTVRIPGANAGEPACLAVAIRGPMDQLRELAGRWADIVREKMRVRSADGRDIPDDLHEILKEQMIQRVTDRGKLGIVTFQGVPLSAGGRSEKTISGEAMLLAWRQMYGRSNEQDWPALGMEKGGADVLRA